VASRTVIVPAQEALFADTQPLNPSPHRWIQAQYTSRNITLTRGPAAAHLGTQCCHDGGTLVTVTGTRVRADPGRCSGDCDGALTA
jgi:hypothetical protein